MNEKLFDIRTVERNIANGLITQADYDNYLKNLSDSSDNAAIVEVELGNDESDIED